MLIVGHFDQLFVTVHIGCGRKNEHCYFGLLIIMLILFQAYFAAWFYDETHTYLSSRAVPSVKRWRQCAVVCTSAVSKRDSSSGGGGSQNVSDWERPADRQSGWKGE